MKIVGVCPLCGGNTKSDCVEVQEMIDDKMYIIKGINAEVCTQCGERMYSENELRCIEKIRDKIAEKSIKPIENRVISIYSAYKSCSV